MVWYLVEHRDNFTVDGKADRMINGYVHDEAMKFLELFYYATYTEPCDFILVKTCLCMFQVAPVTISTHQRRLCGSCGADKTRLSTSRRKNERSVFRETNQHYILCEIGKECKWHLRSALRDVWGKSDEKVRCFWVVQTAQRGSEERGRWWKKSSKISQNRWKCWKSAESDAFRGTFKYQTHGCVAKFTHSEASCRRKFGHEKSFGKGGPTTVDWRTKTAARWCVCRSFESIE